MYCEVQMNNDLNEVREMLTMVKANYFKDGGFVNQEECLSWYADQFGISLGYLKELLEEVKP
jgi:hypothetical protein